MTPEDTDKLEVGRELLYKKGQLQITEPCPNGTEHYDDEPEYASTHYHIYGHFAVLPYPVVYLPHSCDEWVIGGPEQIQDLIDDLTAALKAVSQHYHSKEPDATGHSRPVWQTVQQRFNQEGEGK